MGALLLCPVAAWAQAQTPTPAPPPSQVGKSTYAETESVWSIGVFYWKPTGNAELLGGKKSPNPTAQTVQLFGHPKYSPGLIITAPTGRSNRLEFTAWEAKNNGS